MFVDPPLECDGFCNTVGTQALVNSWRQDISQAHRDMTDWMLMWWTPERLAEEIRVGAYAGPLNAAIPIFDEDRIETILLDVERRQSQIGGGDVWSGKEEARVRHLRFEADM